LKKAATHAGQHCAKACVIRRHDSAFGKERKARNRYPKAKGWRNEGCERGLLDNVLRV